MNRPRAATAARASAAMTSAALRATVSASARTSIFTCVPPLPINLSRGILPATGRYEFLVDLGRPPGIRLVFVDRRLRFHRRIDDAPRLFDVVLPGKQGGVSCHRVSQYPFIGIHLTRTGVTT